MKLVQTKPRNGDFVDINFSLTLLMFSVLSMIALLFLWNDHEHTDV